MSVRERQQLQDLLQEQPGLQRQADRQVPLQVPVQDYPRLPKVYQAVPAGRAEQADQALSVQVRLGPESASQARAKGSARGTVKVKETARAKVTVKVYFHPLPRNLQQQANQHLRTPENSHMIDKDLIRVYR